MLSENFSKVIASAFGLTSLHAGRHEVRNENKQIIDEYWVNPIWVIHLHRPWIPSILLAVAHFIRYEGDKLKEEHQGLLLIPDKNDFLCIQTVKLKWPDPITEALQSVNILPYPDMMSLDGNAHYTVYTFSQGGTGYFEYWATPLNSSSRDFSEVIYEMVGILAKNYENDQINDFLKKSWSPY